MILFLYFVFEISSFHFQLEKKASNSIIRFANLLYILCENLIKNDEAATLVAFPLRNIPHQFFWEKCISFCSKLHSKWVLAQFRQPLNIEHRQNGVEILLFFFLFFESIKSRIHWKKHVFINWLVRNSFIATVYPNTYQIVNQQFKIYGKLCLKRYVSVFIASSSLTTIWLSPKHFVLNWKLKIKKKNPNRNSYQAIKSDKMTCEIWWSNVITCIAS